MEEKRTISIFLTFVDWLLIRVIVKNFCIGNGINREISKRAAVCTGKLFHNAVNHGYCKKGNCMIRIECRIDNSKTKLDIKITNNVFGCESKLTVDRLKDKFNADTSFNKSSAKDMPDIFDVKFLPRSITEMYADFALNENQSIENKENNNDKSSTGKEF